MTLKATRKKKQSLIPPTLTNQHGENYSWVEEMNKSWLNVAAEVEKKVLLIGCNLSEVDPALGKRGSHIRGGLC